MPSFDFHFTTAILYALAAVAAWMQARPAAAVAAPAAHAAQPRYLQAMFAAALVSHGLALGHSLFGGPGLNIGFSHAVSLILWLVMAAYFLIGFDNAFLKLAGMYLAPAAAAAALLPLAIPGQRIVHYGDLAFKAHFVAAMLAYALFTVAALHALLMLVLGKRLHAADLPAALQGMPPLLRMERLLFQLLGVAFVLLTATVGSGVLFSEALFGKAFQLTHKTVFAVFSWLIFGGLLLGHWRVGWRGRLAVQWTLVGFALLLLSYVGSKFVLEIILKRA